VPRRLMADITANERPSNGCRSRRIVTDREMSWNHDKLMGQIAKPVEDKRLLKLIRAFLSAGVMENGLSAPAWKEPRK
jgi:hypothetical protein